MGKWDDLPAAPQIPRPKTLRQTALRYADQCPRAAYAYWANDGGTPSSPLFRGRVFHEVAERVAKTCAETGELVMDQHDAKAILDEVLLEHPEWPVPAKDMEPLRVMVYHFAEHFRCPPSPLIEQRFHLDVSESTVSGTVDLAWVEGQTLFIRDYKASLGGIPSWDDIAGKDDTGKLKGAKAFQLIVYALLIADGVPFESDWKLPQVNSFDVAFVYPFHVNGHGDGLLERGVVIDRSELTEHRSWLRALVNRVEYGFRSGDWPAVPGSTCSICPAPQDCPLPAAMRQREGSSPFERDPSELAEELLFRQRDTDELRKGLKEYAGRFGAIPIGDTLELSHKRTDSRRLTKEGKALLEAGKPVPPDGYVVSEGMRFDVRPKGTGF